MPNWCCNALVVEGDSDSLNHFKEKAKGKGWKDDCPNELDFNQFVPMPQETIDGGYNDCGYEWEMRNWGVKWGSIDVSFGESSGELHYSFDTAWSPPEEMMIVWTEQHPTLTFSLNYEEPGCGFYGSLTTYNGKIISNEQHEMSVEYCHENGEHYDADDHPECEECSKEVQKLEMDKIKKQIDQDYE